MLQLPGAQALRSRRVIGRTLFATALLTASAAVSVVPAATAAPQAPAAAAPARSDAGAPAFQQVAHFYAAYIDAVTAQGGGKLATALRSFYLTPSCAPNWPPGSSATTRTACSAPRTPRSPSGSPRATAARVTPGRRCGSPGARASTPGTRT